MTGLHDMSKSKYSGTFKAHGEWEFSLKDNLVYFSPRDSYNGEGMQLSWDFVLRETREAGLEHWWALIQVGEDMFFTPQASDVLAQNLSKVHEPPLKGMALVVHSSIQRELLERDFSRGHIDYLITEHEDEAREWVMKKSRA